MSGTTVYSVGFATADITPPLGTPIGGNFRDDYASRGVHMPLQAHAMAVRNGDEVVALVSADLLVMTDAMTAEVRRIVELECGLDGGRILVAAIHTHSGPATMALTGEDSMASPSVLAQLAARIAGAVCEALRNARPAELAVSMFEEPRLVFNRRLRMRDGSVRMNWEAVDPDQIAHPLGPVDPQGMVLAARRDGKIIGLVVNYALHPAVLAGVNWDFGPDWPGYLREALAMHVGADVPVVYLNGAQGNVNHLDAWDPRQGRGTKEAQRIGYMLAHRVLAALQDGEELHGPISVARQSVSFPRRPVAADAIQAAERRLEALGDTDVKGQEDGMPAWFFDRELVMHAGRAHEPVEAELQALRIGDLAIVALPGEFFTEYGLALKQRSPAPYTLVAGLANGSVGYVPVPEAVEQGGYEGQTWRYNQLELTAGETATAHMLWQLSALFRTEQENDA